MTFPNSLQNTNSHKPQTGARDGKVGDAVQEEDIVLESTACTRLEPETETLRLEILGIRPHEKHGIVAEINLGNGVRSLYCSTLPVLKENPYFQESGHLQHFGTRQVCCQGRNLHSTELKVSVFTGLVSNFLCYVYVFFINLQSCKNRKNIKT